MFEFLKKLINKWVKISIFQFNFLLNLVIYSVSYLNSRILFYFLKKFYFKQSVLVLFFIILDLLIIYLCKNLYKVLVILFYGKFIQNYIIVLILYYKSKIHNKLINLYSYKFWIIKFKELYKKLLIFQEKYSKLTLYQFYKQWGKDVNVDSLNIVKKSLYVYIVVLFFFVLKKPSVLFFLKKCYIRLRFYQIYLKYYYWNQLYFNYKHLQFFSSFNYTFIRFFYTWVHDLIEDISFLIYQGIIKQWMIYRFNRTKHLSKIFFYKIRLIILFLFFYIYMLFNIIFNYNVFIRNPLDSNMGKFQNHDGKLNWLFPSFALKAIQFFLRPFLRYINSFTIMRLNFRILNRLLYIIVIKEIKNFILFIGRGFIKIFLIIFSSFKTLITFGHFLLYQCHGIVYLECIVWVYFQVVKVLFRFYLQCFQIFKKLVRGGLFLLYIPLKGFEIYGILWFFNKYQLDNCLLIYVFLKKIIIFICNSILFIMFMLICLFLIVVCGGLKFIYGIKMFFFIGGLYYWYKYWVIMRRLNQLIRFLSYFDFFNQKSMNYCIRTYLFYYFKDCMRQYKFSRYLYMYFMFRFNIEVQGVNFRILRETEFSVKKALCRRYNELNTLLSLKSSSNLSMIDRINNLNKVFIIDLSTIVFYMFSGKSYKFKLEAKLFNRYYKLLYTVYCEEYFKITGFRKVDFKLNFNYYLFEYNQYNLMLCVKDDLTVTYIYYILFFNYLLKNHIDIEHEHMLFLNED